MRGQKSVNGAPSGVKHSEGKELSELSVSRNAAERSEQADDKSREGSKECYWRGHSVGQRHIRMGMAEPPIEKKKETKKGHREKETDHA
jgi:hypothetical protein